MNITHRLSEHALLHPDAIALVFASTKDPTPDQITWRALDDLIDEGASFFQRSGSKQPVALHLSNSPALIICFLAIARAGRAALVCDPAWPDHQLNAALENLNPEYIITSDENVKLQVAGAQRVTIRENLRFSELKNHLLFQGDIRGETKPHVHSSDALFYCGFTSGSTGVPKGFMRTHASWLASFEASDVEFKIAPQDCVLASGSLTHSLHLYAIAHALYAGAKAVFTAKFQPSLLAHIIKHENVNVVYGTPTQLDMIANAAINAQLSSVKRVLASGDALHLTAKQRIKQAFVDAQIDTFYGASELSFISVNIESENLPEGCAGRVMHGVNITIRDAQGQICEANQEGFVCVSSAMIFAHYANSRDNRLLRFDDTISVGDRGFLDAQGNLYLTGRFERLIIVAGRNIAPEGLEKTLRSHPYIQEAAIVPLDDARRGQRLAAVIRYDEQLNLSRKDLMVYMRNHHPEYEVPRHYFKCENWPRLASGKTDFKTISHNLNARIFPILN